MRDERTVLLSPDDVLEYVPSGTHHPSTDLHGGEEGEEHASETETAVFEDVPDDDDGTVPVLEGGGKSSRRAPKKETALERWRRRRCRRPERCNNLVNVMQLKLTGPTRARCGKNKTRRRRSRTKRGGTPRGRRTPSPSPSRRAGDDGLFSSIIKSAMGGATLPTLLKQAGGVVLFELLGLLMQGSKSDLLRAIGRTITVDAFTNLISGAITSFSPQNQRTALKRVVDASIKKYGSDRGYAVEVTNLFEVISKKLNGTQFEFTQLAMPILALQNLVDNPGQINGSILSCIFNLMTELSPGNGNGGTRAVFPPEVFVIFKLIADREEPSVDIEFMNNQKKGAAEPHGAAPSAPGSDASSFPGAGQLLGTDASSAPPVSYLPPRSAPCEECDKLRGYVEQLSAMVDFLLTNVKEE